MAFYVKDWFLMGLFFEAKLCLPIAKGVLSILSRLCGYQS